MSGLVHVPPFLHCGRPSLLAAHCAFSQFNPSYPGLHAQVSGATHTLLGDEEEEQIGFVQSMPVQPTRHVHVSALVHLEPFSQICVQVADMARMRLLDASAMYINSVSDSSTPGRAERPAGLLKYAKDEG